ncbi:3608_t:CDS:2 [Racocetra fulgida]|uniref:3608_t:CDS:1 n=1 Tax=Racocetra fulgida TaxID=60492 RepID=A0A9N8VX28_9GLOM|nr:3608_t:CDS:2 [Racocetra fulgida]
MLKFFTFEKVSELMDWLLNNPDLNSIKNLWGIIKDNIEKCIPKN